LGGVVTVTLTLNNVNLAPVAGIVITDPLPAALAPLASSGGTAFLPLPGNTVGWSELEIGARSSYSLSFTARVTTDTLYYGALVSNSAYISVPGFGSGQSEAAEFFIEAVPSTPGIAIISPTDGQTFTATNNISVTLPITVEVLAFSIPDEGTWGLWVDGVQVLHDMHVITATIPLAVGAHTLSATLHATDTVAFVVSDPVNVLVQAAEMRVYLPLVLRDS